MDRNPGGDSSLLAAHRKEGVAEGRAGPHHGLADVGEIIAQHPADGTVREHLHRSRPLFARLSASRLNFTIRSAQEKLTLEEQDNT